jgi:hypothetical protein
MQRQAEQEPRFRDGCGDRENTEDEEPGRACESLECICGGRYPEKNGQDRQGDGNDVIRNHVQGPEGGGGKEQLKKNEVGSAEPGFSQKKGGDKDED